MITKELPEIERPVFIVGPERSGTTLLYSLLANADEFYWFSRIDSLIPAWPRTAEMGRRLFRLFEWRPYIARHGKISSIRGINTPSECNSYWQRFFGWGDEDNYRVEDDRFMEYDLSDDKRQFIDTDLRKRLSFSGKLRLLLKQPGFSLKFKFWNRVFPDALYLVCIRNIRDNTLSLVEAKKASDEKFWGTKVNGWQEYLDVDYRSQALLQLEKIYSVMAADLKNEKIARQTMVVSYDRLISNPESQIKKAVQFCGAKWNSRIAAALKGIVRRDSSSRCDTDLSLPPHQIMKEFEIKAGNETSHVFKK